MHASNSDRAGEAFDYLTLRACIGIIALALPFVVSLVALTRDSITLTSISASYYSSARDLFVGMLFIVGSFLFAYKGHSKTEVQVSNIAAISAYGVALAPTTCDTCTTSPASIIHLVSAGLLFSCLAYFCLGPFRRKLVGMGGKKRLRSRIYLASGIIMLASIAFIALTNLLMPGEAIERLRIVYWGEAIALLAFGTSWFVSGKVLRLFADGQELHSLWQ